MDLRQVNKWRDLAGKAGGLLCLLALLSLLDGLLVHFREPAHVIKLLPGQSVEINGELTDEAHRVEDLTFTSSSDRFKVIFEAIHQGYFLGGDMWRGRLSVEQDIAPGEYGLAVLPKRSASPRKAPDFRILVFPDALSLRKDSASMLRRWFGASPFWVAAGCLPGILLAFAAVYLLSGKREALLAAAGQAEIYRVTRGEGAWEIRFGLGTAHGLGPGAKVAILDERGRPAGAGIVEASNRTDSTARVPADQVIKVGYHACRT
jgi:hypothetical protein